MTERVVVVHDYLTQRGGAERVVLALMQAFPAARLVTSIYNPETTYPEFADFPIDTFWLNRVPALQRDPRRALPLLARAFSSYEVKDADVVVCSSSGWAHGVRTDAPKIVYCHNPPRWLHQTEDYLADQGRAVRLAVDLLRRPLTRWDRKAADSAITYLANSSVVAGRIQNTYGIDADVVPPPVMIDPTGELEAVPGLEPGFLLTVSRSRGYKNTSAVAEAVDRMLPDQRLVVVGGVPDHPDGGTWGPRVVGVTDVPDAQLRWLYANCSSLVAVSHEDFGLTPLEANSFGRPALCLRAGGYLDTLVPGRNGLYVEDETPSAVADAIVRSSLTVWNEVAIRAHARRYSPDLFAAHLRSVANRVSAVPVPAIAIPRQRTSVESLEPVQEAAS
jgi:glycosyltransferase involved in cell wall biosynthesis